MPDISEVTVRLVAGEQVYLGDMLYLTASGVFRRMWTMGPDEYTALHNASKGEMVDCVPREHCGLSTTFDIELH